MGPIFVSAVAGRGIDNIPFTLCAVVLREIAALCAVSLLFHRRRRSAELENDHRRLPLQVQTRSKVQFFPLFNFG